MSSKPVVVKAKRVSAKQLAEIRAKTEAIRAKADRDAETKALWDRINAGKERKAREEEALREAEIVALEARINDYEARFAKLPQAKREHIEKYAGRCGRGSDNLDFGYHMDYQERKAKLQALMEAKGL
jgi:tetrahydromethanopterin S-methyltransferase subunit A